VTGAWIPRLLPGVQVTSLELGAREGYVLSRIDGATDEAQLVQITGIPPEEVRGILESLAAKGAIDGPPRPSSPLSDPTSSAEQDRNGTGSAAPEATHRALFETRLHPRSEDERAALAERAAEPELTALCFDPVPAVIRRVLQNQHVGLAHARLIAAHHRNPVGLEAVAARASFMGDREVQRLLLRNSQSPETVVRRILASRRLAEVHALGQSHELPERHRATARSALRRGFAAASPEERVELIVGTEGRVLAALSGLALDGRSAALLCARSLTSTLLVENLARWPATPPPVIGHLLKHPLLRQAPALRALVRRHPNCPGSAP
jgi:hypothetical protein